MPGYIPDDLSPETRRWDSVSPNDVLGSVMGFIKKHVAVSAVSIGLTHPLRILMNRCIKHQTFFGVFRDLPQYWRSGFLLNLTRGTAILTAQSVGQQIAEYLYGETESPLAKATALLGATIGGAGAATLMESPLNRVTNSLPGQVQRLTRRGFSSARFPLYRLTPMLAIAYIIRDSNFNYIVRIGPEISPWIYVPTIPIAAFMTVTAQNISLRASTDDILKGQKRTVTRTAPNASAKTAPKKCTKRVTGPWADGMQRMVTRTAPTTASKKCTKRVTGLWADGMKHTVTRTAPNASAKTASEKCIKRVTGPWVDGMQRMVTRITPTIAPEKCTKRLSVPMWSVRGFFSIMEKTAKGKYTHPDYRVPIRNPTNFIDYGRNLFSVFCGAKMFSYRTLYVSSVMLTMKEMKKQILPPAPVQANTDHKFKP